MINSQLNSIKPSTLDIIMPCHNTSPELITSAVNSVICEKHYFDRRNITTLLIMVDDASSNTSTIDTIHHYSALYEWIRVLFLETNHGPAGSRNEALSVSNSDWVAFLDSDDYWLPGAVAAMWDEVSRDSSIEWITGDFYIEHTDEGIDDKTFYPQHPDRYKYLAQAYHLNCPVRLHRPVDQFMEGNLCSMGSCLISSKLLRKVGLFDASLKKGVDTELYWKLAKEADLVFLPLPIFVYRRYPGTVSHDGKNLSDWEPPVLQKMLATYTWQPYRKSIKRRLLRSLINISAIANKTEKSIKGMRYSFEAIKLKPYGLRPWLAFVYSIYYYLYSFLKHPSA